MVGGMERNEVSKHELLVVQALCEHQDWISAKEVAERTGVAPRTARAHALKLVKLGIVEQAEVFPGHRYRISGFASKRNRGYVDRLKKAAEVLDISLPL